MTITFSLESFSFKVDGAISELSAEVVEDFDVVRERYSGPMTCLDSAALSISIDLY